MPLPACASCSGDCPCSFLQSLSPNSVSSYFLIRILRRSLVVFFLLLCAGSQPMSAPLPRAH